MTDFLGAVLRTSSGLGKKGAKMLHRDDMSDEEIELFEQMAREISPDAKLIFMGDVPRDRIPREVMEAYEEEKRDMEESVSCGICADCGEEIPGYERSANFDAPDGWFAYFDHHQSLVCYRCEDCHVLWMSGEMPDICDDEDDEDEDWTGAEYLSPDFE